MNSSLASTHSTPLAIKHVLVVDAEHMIRTVLGSLLNSWGFTTCLAGNLACACRMVVSGGPFDAIICNYDLPDGDAFDLIDWMRSQQLEVPTVVPYGALRPKTGPQDNVKLVPKPFDPAELREAIERASRHCARKSRPLVLKKRSVHSRH